MQGQGGLGLVSGGERLSWHILVHRFERHLSFLTNNDGGTLVVEVKRAGLFHGRVRGDHKHPCMFMHDQGNFPSLMRMENKRVC